MDAHEKKVQTMNTEDQLYKFKSKLYRETGANGKQTIIEGFSLFFDEATRVAIKEQVKKEMIRQKKIKLAKKGHNVDSQKLQILDDNQMMLKILEESVQLMKKDENESESQEEDEYSPKRIKSPFRHIKVKNIERVIHFLRQSNDKQA